MLICYGTLYYILISSFCFLALEPWSHGALEVSSDAGVERNWWLGGVGLP
jgi:hypothetical protein